MLPSFTIPISSHFENIIEKYKRRAIRFSEYKNSTDNYIFIRNVRLKDDFSTFSDIFNCNKLCDDISDFNEKTYNNLKKYLPKKSRIILLFNKNDIKNEELKNI